MDERNKSVEDYATFISNHTAGNYSATGIAFRFINPFQIPFARVLFITCYATVFATCIVGEYCLFSVCVDYISFGNRR